MKLLRVLLLVVAVLGTVVATPTATYADGCQEGQIDCIHGGGNQDDGSIVTGGVIWPHGGGLTVPGGGGGSSCDGCEWKLVVACMFNGPDNPDDVLCAVAAMSCAARGEDGILYRVYFRPGPDAVWQMLGSRCIGPDDRPIPIADIQQGVRDQVVNYLPDADPSFQPAAGGIVNLPTIFAAGEDGSFETPTFPVLGLPVKVTATARWVWTFDDGVTKSFTVPGGPYPDDSVSWTYATPGGRSVSVTTYWDGQFTVAGQGPYDVPGPAITKTAGPVAVPVREANSHLVGG
jgi:hypothetical protein